MGGGIIGIYFVPLTITLVLGVTVALICRLGTCFLSEDGHWKLSDKDTKDTKETLADNVCLKNIEAYVYPYLYECIR